MELVTGRMEPSRQRFADAARTAIDEKLLLHGRYRKESLSF
jgi:hypothetical protein